MESNPNLVSIILLFSNVKTKLLQLLWEHYKTARCSQVDSRGRKYLHSSRHLQISTCILPAGNLQICLPASPNRHNKQTWGGKNPLSATPWLAESLNLLKPQTAALQPYLPRISQLSPQTDKASTFLNPSAPLHKFPTSCWDAHWKETDATAKIYPL